jgi:hypothetical protein
MPLIKIWGASFLGQQSIRTRRILLGFYPSVQRTSQFMSHNWELVVCMERQSIRIYNFSRLVQTWPEQCGWEWWGYAQYNLIAYWFTLLVNSSDNRYQGKCNLVGNSRPGDKNGQIPETTVNFLLSNELGQHWKIILITGCGHASKPKRGPSAMTSAKKTSSSQKKDASHIAVPSETRENSKEKPLDMVANG